MVKALFLAHSTAKISCFYFLVVHIQKYFFRFYINKKKRPNTLSNTWSLTYFALSFRSQPLFNLHFQARKPLILLGFIRKRMASMRYDVLS